MKNIRRGTELENIVGYLLITEYQVEKLRARVIEKSVANMLKHLAKVYPHTFKHDSIWIKISARVDEMTLDKTRDSINTWNRHSE